jgi:hypothetical protein
VTPTSLQEDIPPSMLTVRRFLEDEAREWRELDYQIEVVNTVHGQLCHTVLTIFIKVGKPPTSFCSFLRQYDWNIFTLDGLTAKVDLIILICGYSGHISGNRRTEKSLGSIQTMERKKKEIIQYFCDGTCSKRNG